MYKNQISFHYDLKTLTDHNFLDFLFIPDKCLKIIIRNFPELNNFLDFLFIPDKCLKIIIRNFPELNNFFDFLFIPDKCLKIIIRNFPELNNASIYTVRLAFN